MSFFQGPFHLLADQLLLVLICAILMSVIGLGFALYFETLIFLDTLGTAFIALALGPVWGATFGALTNLIVATNSKTKQYQRFWKVNALCGALWGLAGRWLWQHGDAFVALRFVDVVLIMGLVVGFISGLVATCMRLRMSSSQHVLDQVRDQLRNQKHGYFLIAPVEFAISHFPDKALTSAVALLLVFLIASPQGADSAFTRYRDSVDILSAFYFVAFGVAVKVWKIDFPQGSLFALLGPLGFLSVLSALPALLQL